MRHLIALALGAALAFTVTACTGTATDAKTVSAPAPAALAVDVEETSLPSRIRIPALDVDTKIIELGLQPNGKMGVPDGAEDAGWFTRSPSPGEIGPALIAAHVNYQGVDGPFAKLDQLKAGDRVDIENDNGATVSFTVDRVERHPKAAFPHDAVYGDTAGPELRLVTCGGAFDPGSGHYLDNTIAWAKLST